MLRGQSALKSNDTGSEKRTEKFGGRVLAIDYGDKRVGLAISDPWGIIAQGAGTVLNDETLLSRLAGLVVGKDVQHIIIGMPYRADGSKGTKAGEIERFATPHLHGQCRQHAWERWATPRRTRVGLEPHDHP